MQIVFHTKRPRNPTKIHTVYRCEECRRLKSCEFAEFDWRSVLQESLKWHGMWWAGNIFATWLTALEVYKLPYLCPGCTLDICRREAEEQERIYGKGKWICFSDPVTNDIIKRFVPQAELDRSEENDENLKLDGWKEFGDDAPEHVKGYIW